MTVIFADFPSGFSGLYGTNDALMLNGIYAQTSDVSIIEDPDPNVTGNVLRVAGFSTVDGLARFVMPGGANSVAGIRSNVWLPALPTGNGDTPLIHQFRTAANGVLVSILVRPDGGIQAWSGGDNINWSSGGATLLGETAGPVLTANAWAGVETKMLRDAAVGTVEVRVNGVTKLNLTAQNTGAANIGQLAFANAYSGSGVGAIYYVKNTAFWDGSGASGNDFIGNATIYPLLTNSDVAMSWVLSSGSTGFDLLDESPPNDADYIEAIDPPPAAALCGLTNLPADVTSVIALISVVRAWKTDGGNGNLQVGLKATTLTDLGTDRPLTTAPTYYFDASMTDPDTAAAWTPVVVDTVQSQFDRTL